MFVTDLSVLRPVVDARLTWSVTRGGCKSQTSRFWRCVHSHLAAFGSILVHCPPTGLALATVIHLHNTPRHMHAHAHMSSFAYQIAPADDPSTTTPQAAVKQPSQGGGAAVSLVDLVRILPYLHPTRLAHLKSVSLRQLRLINKEVCTMVTPGVTSCTVHGGDEDRIFPSPVGVASQISTANLLSQRAHVEPGWMLQQCGIENVSSGLFKDCNSFCRATCGASHGTPCHGTPLSRLAKAGD